MPKVGTGKISALSLDGVALPMAFAVIALCIAGNVSAHGGGLNAEGCHNDRKRGGYHCHRGGASSSRSTSIPGNSFTPSRVAPLGASQGSDVFSNCAEARAADAAPVKRGEPGYGPHLDRDGDGVGCEPRRR